MSFADKDTSPITRFFNAGIGGNGPIASRRNDEFGFSHAYTDLSSVLKDNLNLITLGLRRPQPEQQFEGFYAPGPPKLNRGIPRCNATKSGADNADACLFAALNIGKE